MGEIGNKRLLRNIGKFLNILDVKQAPSEFDTSRLVLAQDLIMGGFNGYTASLGSSGDLAVNGVSSKNVFPVGERAGSSETPLIATDNQEARVLALNCALTMDAAGAAFLATTRINLRWVLVPKNVASDTTAGCEVVNLNPWFVGDADVRFVPFALGGAAWHSGPFGGDANEKIQIMTPRWDGWVPADFFLRVELASQGAVNFPANTTFRVDVVAALQERGVRLPK